MLKPINILISEDEKLNFLLLKTLFEKTIGHPVIIQHAINGQQAIDLCNENTDLILMDVEMPIMNGFDATEILKQRFPNTPIIIQTAHCSQEHKEKALALGCTAFLSKPIIRKDFEELVMQFILPTAC